MEMLRVLIVEDEPLIAMDLEEMVTEAVPAAVTIKSSVASAKMALREAVDFAFLDVDVTNGKTYEIAYLLERQRIPFAFVSASSRSHLPSELRNVPFFLKPVRPSDITRILQASLSRQKDQAAQRRLDDRAAPEAAALSN